MYSPSPLCNPILIWGDRQDMDESFHARTRYLYANLLYQETGVGAVTFAKAQLVEGNQPGAQPHSSDQLHYDFGRRI